MSFTDQIEKDILDFLLGDFTNFATPETVFIMLSTTTPGEVSGSLNFTEPSTENGYAAVEVDNDNTTWEYVDGVIKNKIAIEFPEATGAWGTITHFGVEGNVGSSGKIMIGTGALSASKTVEAGDKPRFNAGALTISLD
jgi:hypothetical protein